jgi:hypothetical protein
MDTEACGEDLVSRNPLVREEKERVRNGSFIRQLRWQPAIIRLSECRGHYES